MKPSRKLAFGVALIASMLFPFAVVQSATAATSPGTFYCPGGPIITNADNGNTITMVTGTCATLSLDPNLVWATPESSSKAVSVYDVETFAPDQMWGLYAVRAGNATITSTGRPNCAPGEICPLFLALFKVHIHVVPPYGATDGA